MVVILSAMAWQRSFNPFPGEGESGIRSSGTEVSSVVNPQTVTEGVSSNRLS